MQQEIKIRLWFNLSGWGHILIFSGIQKSDFTSFVKPFFLFFTRLVVIQLSSSPQHCDSNVKNDVNTRANFQNIKSSFWSYLSQEYVFVHVWRNDLAFTGLYCCYSVLHLHQRRFQLARQFPPPAFLVIVLDHLKKKTRSAFADRRSSSTFSLEAYHFHANNIKLKSKKRKEHQQKHDRLSMDGRTWRLSRANTKTRQYS